MKVADLCGVAPCGLVDTDRRFSDTYFLNHQCLVMVAVSISEASVTRRNIPEYNLLKN
jgi:hypothetical protein